MGIFSKDESEAKPEPMGFHYQVEIQPKWGLIFEEAFNPKPDPTSGQVPARPNPAFLTASINGTVQFDRSIPCAPAVLTLPSDRLPWRSAYLFDPFEVENILLPMGDSPLESDSVRINCGKGLYRRSSDFKKGEDWLVRGGLDEFVRYVYSITNGAISIEKKTGEPIDHGPMLGNPAFRVLQRTVWLSYGDTGDGDFVQPHRPSESSFAFEHQFVTYDVRVQPFTSVYKENIGEAHTDWLYKFRTKDGRFVTQPPTEK